MDHLILYSLGVNDGSFSIGANHCDRSLELGLRFGPLADRFKLGGIVEAKAAIRPSSP